MATYDIAATRAALKSLLSTIAGIAFIYDYTNPDIAGYPAIIFDVSNEDAEMLDEANNVRTIQFSIWILQEIPVAGEQAAKSSLDAIAKAVINALELSANTTLGNTVDWTMPVSGKRQHMPTPQGDAFVQEIMLNAKVASAIV